MNLPNKIVVLPHPGTVTPIHNLLHFNRLLSMLNGLMIVLRIVHIVLGKGVIHPDKKRVILPQPFLPRIENKIDRSIDKLRPILDKPLNLSQMTLVGESTRKMNLVQRLIKTVILIRSYKVEEILTYRVVNRMLFEMKNIGTSLLRLVRHHFR